MTSQKQKRAQEKKAKLLDKKAQRRARHNKSGHTSSKKALEKQLIQSFAPSTFFDHVSQKERLAIARLNKLTIEHAQQIIRDDGLIAFLELTADYEPGKVNQNLDYEFGRLIPGEVQVVGTWGPPGFPDHALHVYVIRTPYGFSIGMDGALLDDIYYLDVPEFIFTKQILSKPLDYLPEF